MRRPILQAVTRLQFLSSPKSSASAKPTSSTPSPIPHPTQQCRHNSSSTAAPVLTPPPQPQPQPLSQISQQLRTSMRSLPYPVIILTTPPIPSSSSSSPATTPTPPTPTIGHGITLSSLSCLSLSPYPLITFNIKTPSRTSLSLHATGKFTIHILSATPHSAFVAGLFAQLDTAYAEKMSPWERLRGNVELRDGVPVMGRGDAVVSRWDVVKERCVEVQDHEIWVGRVVGVEELGEETTITTTTELSELTELTAAAVGKDLATTSTTAAAGDGLTKEKEPITGLMYQNRKFRQVGEEVIPAFGSFGDSEAKVKEVVGGKV
ncbi:flavin reductase like domain-containing protein [Pyronema omphalodes]|nr:flavin reductase like domain-containing protein [Pyronema omphalodes]